MIGATAIPEFYEGELWKSELENVLLPMLDKYEVVVVEDADGLIRWDAHDQVSSG